MSDVSEQVVLTMTGAAAHPDRRSCDSGDGSVRPGRAGRTRADDSPTITVHPLLKAADLARVLGVGERSVWRMVSRASATDFPRPVRIGGHVVRWRWEDVEKYLQELSRK